ncbi:IclR family transcriptional regulator [Sporosarcina sp. FSL W7-1349]|uniref:IclR family transcriptional regulator n=1 Tax=Sporosarcina sp. FSL W7-1349 TaxID=2921561 RepID=UPI0030F9E939
MSSEKPLHRLNTVNNAISLLAMFIKYDSIGLVEIEEEVGISKTAAFRLVATMADRGMLIRDEKTKRYLPGPLLFQLVRKSQFNDVVAIAQPHIQELAEMTSESIYLSIRSGYKYIYLTGIDSPQLLKVTIPFGDENDLYFGAAGNLHLAYMSPAEIENYAKRTTFEAFTPRTITDPAQLSEKLAQIREAGFSISLAERMPDAGGVAAPIWDHGAEPAATIGIYFPMSRLDDDKKDQYIELVKTYAHKISEEAKAGRN